MFLMKSGGMRTLAKSYCHVVRAMKLELPTINIDSR